MSEPDFDDMADQALFGWTIQNGEDLKREIVGWLKEVYARGKAAGAEMERECLVRGLRAAAKVAAAAGRSDVSDIVMGFARGAEQMPIRTVPKSDTRASDPPAEVATGTSADRYAGPRACVSNALAKHVHALAAECRRLRREVAWQERNGNAATRCAEERKAERDQARAVLARAVELLGDCYGLANGLPFRNNLTAEVTAFLTEHGCAVSSPSPKP